MQMRDREAAFRVAADIGGTFTELVGEVRLHVVSITLLVRR